MFRPFFVATLLMSSTAIAQQIQPSVDPKTSPSSSTQSPRANNTNPGAHNQGAKAIPYTTRYCVQPFDIHLQPIHMTSTRAQQQARKTVQPQAMTIGGDAVLEVFVGRDGKVLCVRGLSGDKNLVDAASAAVSQWEYSPYFLNGEPIYFVTQVTIHFKPKTN